MMSDNKIIALIQGMSTEVSAQYNGVGIKSMIFVEPNIFRYTLNDASSTIVDVPVDNFNNYSVADKSKVMKLITNGLGDKWLNDKGFYSKPSLNNILNYNKPIIITLNDWRQDGILERYTLTVDHNLNTENIVPALWNSSNKLETIGIERLNNKQVRLESTEPLSGVLVLNYSTTDASDSLNNIATIKTEYNFDTMADVNTYFTNTPQALENRLIIGVGINPVKILMWTGITSPSTYTSNTDETLWSDQTAVVGIKGDIGAQGERGYSDYELAKQNGFVGTLENWLESIDSCLGKFDTAEALISKYPPVDNGYPNGVNSHKFALVADINGTGLVSMAFYDATTTHKWNLVKLNQSIPASQSTSIIGVTGNTVTRLSLLNNPDWLGKEYLFFDDDLHILLLYKQGCGFLQYSGQEVSTIAPQNPSEGDIWIGYERIYTWNNTSKFWKIKLKDYLKKYELTTQGSYLSEAINGASIRFKRDSNDIYSISIYQDNGMDYLIYTVNTYDEQEIMLNKDDEQIIIPNLQTDENTLITIHLKHEGGGISANVIRYGNVLFLTSFTKLINEDPTYQSMSTIERKQYKQDLRNDSRKKVVYDTDLDVEMLYRPKDNDIGTFIQNVGQYETDQFPTTNLIDGQTYTSISSGLVYNYYLVNDYWKTDGLATEKSAGKMSASDKEKLDNIMSPPKNNLTATSIPTVSDDTSKGYSAGSMWIYNSITYTCQDSTQGKALWLSSADITYFDDWASTVVAISQVGSTYVNKYIVIANANGAPPTGTTYVAPNTISNPIIDGGTATYKVITQGANYSVYCLKRVIINPIISSVQTISIAKPITSGYYIFTVTPTDLLPIGCQLNDICYYDGSTWSKFQSYSTANGTILVGTSPSTQVTWKKQGGSWVNTTGVFPESFDITKSYTIGQNAMYNGMVVKANADIPVNTTFAWGTTGATWTPILGFPLKWKGIYADTNAYNQNDVVATSTSSDLYRVNTNLTASTNNNPTTGVNRFYWQVISPAIPVPFTSPTDAISGRIGAVPAPSVGQQRSVLTGNGWGSKIYRGYVNFGGPNNTGSVGYYGDIYSAYKGDGTNLTITHPPTSGNAIYSITVENYGQASLSNDTSPLVFTRNGNNSIVIFMEPMYNTTGQSLRLNIIIVD